MVSNDCVTDSQVQIQVKHIEQLLVMRKHVYVTGIILTLTNIISKISKWLLVINIDMICHMMFHAKTHINNTACVK